MEAEGMKSLELELQMLGTVQYGYLEPNSCPLQE